MQKSKKLCWKSVVLVAYMTGRIVLDFYGKSLLRNGRSKLLLVLQVPVMGMV